MRSKTKFDAASGLRVTITHHERRKVKKFAKQVQMECDISGLDELRAKRRRVLKQKYKPKKWIQKSLF